MGRSVLLGRHCNNDIVVRRFHPKTLHAPQARPKVPKPCNSKPIVEFKDTCPKACHKVGFHFGGDAFWLGPSLGFRVWGSGLGSRDA